MQRIPFINQWNKLLPILLIFAGVGVMAVALTADLLFFGGPLSIGPKQASLALSGFAVLLAGVLLISPTSLRYISEWLLVGLAAVAVAFAADLVVINGLPEIGAKQIVLISSGLCVLLIGIIPVPLDRQSMSAWIHQVTLEKLRIGKLFSIATQLGLLVLVTSQFHLENQAVYHSLMLLTFYGFIIHYFLPSRYRLTFFLLLSLIAILGILGLSNGIWLIAMGLALIGICHLPISYSARAGLLLVGGIALAAARVNWIPAPWLTVIWPVLASMFMFRLLIYIYDLKNGKATPTLTSSLAYFFLLPNVVFPFFPVVDYSTFRRTYYSDDQFQIYQKGLRWMFRGVLQLILYRYINNYLMISPENVTNTAELVRYLIVNFSLYIQISGQFHFIVGLLHLFGFNLPETNHLYFLASSFTDLWRRINIYWKDFMMKLFFYPIYFRIRKWGPTLSLAFATFCVFFITWFLHAYQWFWLRGTFLFTAQDILFWSILATLVVINTLYENRRGRKRTLGQTTPGMREIITQALRGAGTFSIMAILWSLWSSDSIRDWISLLSIVKPTAQNIATLLAVFLAITIVFSLAIWMYSRPEKSNALGEKQVAFFKTAAATGGSLLLLFVVGNPLAYTRIGGAYQSFVHDMTVNRLSDREAALLQRGYYEDLVGVSRFNSQLWEIYSKRPTDWPTLTETEAARQTGNNLIVELVPSVSITFHGEQMTINRWGMRDIDYELTPAPNTYRIALAGPSFVMGYGVADGEDFGSLLEARLNRENAGPYARYEILNFAVPGYSPIQNLMVLEQKIPSFKPNALFYVAHQREEEAAVMYLADRISAAAELPYPGLLEIAHQAGAETSATKVENERRLQPVESDLLVWTYRQIVETAHAQGILPVWIFMPTLEYPLQGAKITHLANLAQEAGFIVINLTNAYDHQDPESIVVAYWDKHPNAKAHQLIADSLYQALWEKREAIPLFGR